MEQDFTKTTDQQSEPTTKQVSAKKCNLSFIILLILALLVVGSVFLPWRDLYVSIDDELTCGLRAFGFATMAGIVGIVTGLGTVVAVLYKKYHYALLGALASVIVGLFAINSHPDCKLYDVNMPEHLENELKKVGIVTLDDIEVPGLLVTGLSKAVGFIDQPAVKDLFEDKLPDDFSYDITNNRLGALIFLILSALLAIGLFVVVENERKSSNCQCFLQKNE